MFQAETHEIVDKRPLTITACDTTRRRAKRKLQLFIKLLEKDRPRYCFTDMSLERMEQELNPKQGTQT